MAERKRFLTSVGYCGKIEFGFGIELRSLSITNPMKHAVGEGDD